MTDRRISGLVRIAGFMILASCAAGTARAQSAIAGVVKDASGAVLPGVTVEASSPALIEGSRSAVTDSAGAYRIADLRPGEYTVAFSLTGFRSVRREVCQVVADGTGIHQYAIDHVFQNMMERCKELKLRVTLPETQAKQQLMIMLTVQTMNIVHSGYHHIAV